LIDDIVNDGKSVIIDISFDQSSGITCSLEIGSEKGLPLSDTIEMWMERMLLK
jgi:hypothetical protein